MKKLLILILVLSMASLANATLQISVNGIMDPVDSELHTYTSPFVLGIWTDSDISLGVGEGVWALACDTVFGTISGGIVVPPYDTEPFITIYDDAVGGGFPLPPGENGVWGTIILSGAIDMIPAGATIYDEIELCVEYPWGDTSVTLYTTYDGETFTPVDSVVFHAPAEPTTILLLGLSIVAIRQRRRR